MDHFQEIFTPLESPAPDYDPRENILNQIRQMEDGDRRDARVRQFINQFQAVDEQESVVGEQISPVPTVNPPINPNPANVQIVNKYNSFNLANITPPVPPKWKQPDNLLDEFCKSRHSCQWIFDGPMCHITSGKVKTSMLLIWAGPDGEDMTALICHHIRPMMFSMYCSGFKSFVSPSATLELLDLNSQRFPSDKEKLSTHSTTEYLNWLDSVHFQTSMSN